ncbi:MFS transporter [Bailinhaonella thermotolerans]|uniref:MFS transporter n=1 Tax=Bailinhaonella thermotolerans TaxID=1070861 RepID=A0A3A4A2R8_9ACTN|nr:MFS transporter [Bailinhaonella thermotolerans]
MWTRDFRLYFTARTVSMFGDAMMHTALTMGLLEAGYGPAGVGFALAAWTASVAVLILFGGVLADKFTARRMMIGADAARFLLQGLMAVLFLVGTPPFWQILVIMALSGAATAMFQPGVGSTVPQVASDVQRANATLKVAESLMVLIGPAVAGPLVAVAGAGVVFGLDAATFAVSGLCLLLLRLRPLADVVPEGSMLRNLREGWREFRSRTWLWSVIVIWTFMGICVFGPMLPLGATVIRDAHGAAMYGVVMSAYGAGTILGGLVGMRLRPRRTLLAGGCAMLLYPLGILMIATAAPLGMLIAAEVLAGAGWAFWSVMWATSIQTNIPGPVLNRITAYEVSGSIMSVPVGQAIAGPAMLLFGGPHQVLFVSVAVSFASCVALFSVPAIRRLRRGPAS